MRRRDLYVFTSSRKHFISSHSLPTVFIRANPQPPPADQEIPSALPSTATISISSSIFSSSSSFFCSNYYYPDLVYTQHRPEVCRRPCVGQIQDRRDTFGAVWPTATIQTSAICANIPWICADLCISANILCICVNIRNLFRAASERFVKEIWRYKWPAPPSSSNSSSCVNGRKNPVAAPERFSSGNFVFSSLIAWPCPSLRGAQNIYQVGFI